MKTIQKDVDRAMNKAIKTHEKKLKNNIKIYLLLVMK